MQMPTALGHAMVGLGCGALVASRQLPRRARLSTVAVLVLLAALPDLDVIAFALGIPYRDPFGHRGFFHSLFFTTCCGAIAWWIHRLSIRLYSDTTLSWSALLVFLIVATSHPLLDMLTDGGLGIALGAPFSNERLFFPTQPIPVSPIGLSARLQPILLWEAAVFAPPVVLIWIGRRIVLNR